MSAGCLLCLALMIGQSSQATRVSIVDGRWHLNGKVLYPGTAVEGRLMNVRMVNATFEDRNRADFDADANCDEFIAQIPSYVDHGVRAFTLCLQGGMPGYEGALNSAFNEDGSLRDDYMQRVARVIRACDQQQVVVILGLFYQRQSKVLSGDEAIRNGIINAVQWVKAQGFENVVIEIANEYPHGGFVHPIIRNSETQAELIRLAQRTAPGILVSASGYGDGKVGKEVAEASDFLLPHFNGTPVAQIPERIAALRVHGKPIVCNEDDKVGQQAVAAMEATVAAGASYGLMLVEHNQHFPFHFHGARDDSVYYERLKEVTHESMSADEQ